MLCSIGQMFSILMNEDEVVFTAILKREPNRTCLARKRIFEAWSVWICRHHAGESVIESRPHLVWLWRLDGFNVFMCSVSFRLFTSRVHVYHPCYSGIPECCVRITCLADIWRQSLMQALGSSQRSCHWLTSHTGAKKGTASDAQRRLHANGPPLYI